MGVTINYRGRLKTSELIEPLIAELGALSQEAGWDCDEFGPEPYQVFDHISVRLRGIEVQVHPDGEMLSLIFDELGRLVSMPGLDIISSDGFIVEKEDEPGAYVTVEMPPPEKLAELTWDSLANRGEINMAFVKTQFAGAETHILLCKLLHYLEKKYFAEFEVIDEGGYYYTGDASRLARKLAFLSHIIDNASTTSWSEIIKPLPDDAPLEDRLQDIVRYLEVLAQSAPIKPEGDDDE